MTDNRNEKVSREKGKLPLKSDEKAAELRRHLEEKKKDERAHQQDLEIKGQFRQF